MSAAFLPPDRWRRFEPAEHWRDHRAWFLGDDNPDSIAVQRILVTGDWQPDSFTVTERLCGPAWLDEHERDPGQWLHSLVGKRLGTVPAELARPAQAHVLEQMHRLLELPHLADHLYNQEVAYVVDRMATWCLLEDPDAGFGLFDAVNAAGHRAVAGLLTRRGHLFTALEPVQAIRIAVAAGLLGLDLKGGTSACEPIRLAGWIPRNTPGIAARLLTHADRTPAADDTGAFLADDTSGACRLMWWLDDVNETAFDLLVIQQLLDHNRRLRVTAVAKTGRWDNDATNDDVHTFLSLAPFAALRGHLERGRFRLTAHGPRMATVNPHRLHESVLDEIASCDLMVCKGGRIHEMFNGQLRVPTYTGIVLAREFSETTAGFDATTAPLLWFRTAPGEWSWWGFQGRTRTLTLPGGRVIRASHVTHAEHREHATSHDTGLLAVRLRGLLTRWPHLQPRYHTAAAAELTLLAQRLASHGGIPEHAALLTEAKIHLMAV